MVISARPACSRKANFTSTKDSWVKRSPTSMAALTVGLLIMANAQIPKVVS